MELIKSEYGLNTMQLIDLLILIMVSSGVCGFIYELFFYKIDTGKFVKRGSSYGPWIPIYAFGGLAYALLVYRFKDKVRHRMVSLQYLRHKTVGLQHRDMEFRKYWRVCLLQVGLCLWPCRADADLCCHSDAGQADEAFRSVACKYCLPDPRGCICLGLYIVPDYEIGIGG